MIILKTLLIALALGASASIAGLAVWLFVSQVPNGVYLFIAILLLGTSYMIARER